MPYPSWIYWRKKCMSKIICVFRSINCVFTIVQICFATNSWFWTWEQVSSDFVLLQTYSMADHTVKRHQITIKQMHCYCYCCWVLVNDGRAGWSRTCFSYCPLKMWQGALNQTTWSHFQEIADGLISFAQSHWFGCYKILKKNSFHSKRDVLIWCNEGQVNPIQGCHCEIGFKCTCFFSPFSCENIDNNVQNIVDSNPRAISKLLLFSESNMILLAPEKQHHSAACSPLRSVAKRLFNE